MSHVKPGDPERVPFAHYSYYRAVVFRWERLRIFYNLALLIVMFGAILLYPGPFATSSFTSYVLYRAFQANILFFAGHITDLVISWAGFGSRVVTGTLFALGTLLSAFLTFAAVGMYVLVQGD